MSEHVRFLKRFQGEGAPGRAVSRRKTKLIELLEWERGRTNRNIFEKASQGGSSTGERIRRFGRGGKFLRKVEG